jgi:hypothetical protein
MAKTLLFKNEPAIAGDKKYINDLLPYLQNVATELTSLNVTFSIMTIRELTFIVFSRRGLTEVVDFITNLIVEAIDNPQIGNIPISKDKLKGIIEKPDCTQLFKKLTQLIEKSYNPYRNATNIVYSSFFEVTNGIVSKLANIDTTIEENNSFYSENANQIEMFTKATEFANACNAFETYLKSKNRNIDNFKLLEDLEIITKRTNGITGADWVPSMTFITNNFR